MKSEKSIKEPRIERPRRAVVSEKETVKRMKDFSKRKEKFVTTANHRLARESAKLNKGQEQELADEGLVSEADEWAEY